MARLPNPGGDSGTWGTLLNDYLSQVHNTDGTLKSGSVDESNLAIAVQNKLNATIHVSDVQGITVSATAPSNPAVGDIWIDLGA